MEKLLFCCLLSICSISLGRMSPIVFEELFKTVGHLNEIAKMDTNKLHSPQGAFQDCLLSVFKCFVNQSSLLEPVDHKNENDFNNMLLRLKSSHRYTNLTDTNLNCQSCNSYDLQPPKIFLRNFQLLLQRLNYLQNMKPTITQPL
nr:interleukin-21 [Pogona vitticeps]